MRYVTIYVTVGATVWDQIAVQFDETTTKLENQGTVPVGPLLARLAGLSEP